MPNFKWDRNKEKGNFQKHGISFEEAASVFRDDYSLTRYDSVHSTEEDRYINIGRSVNGKILVVVYTEQGDAIRIISCRKATTTERTRYEKQSA